MRSLAELILSFCDVMEAEGRLLRVNILHTVRGCLLMILGFSFAAVALGLFIASGYEWLLGFFSKTAALAIMGAISGIIALILLWSTASCAKRNNTKKQADTKKTT